MMQKLVKLSFIFCVFLLFSFKGNSQMLHPAKWHFSVEKTSDAEATLVFKVTLDPEWHIYSQFTPEGGSMPTEFTFNKGTCYQLDGKVTEPAPHKEYDKDFQVDVWSFADEVIFKQKI